MADTTQGGLQLPRKIGWAAITVGAAAILGGIGTYYDLTNRVSNVDNRVSRIESTALQQAVSWADLRDRLARIETRLDILIEDRNRSAPYPPVTPAQ